MLGLVNVYSLLFVCLQQFVNIINLLYLIFIAEKFQQFQSGLKNGLYVEDRVSPQSVVSTKKRCHFWASVKTSIVQPIVSRGVDREKNKLCLSRSIAKLTSYLFKKNETDQYFYDQSVVSVHYVKCYKYEKVLKSSQSNPLP